MEQSEIKKPVSKNLELVLKTLGFRTLYHMLTVLFPGQHGRPEVTRVILNLMQEKGIEINLCQSTIWNWVINAHKFNEFSEDDWHFHGRQKNSPTNFLSKIKKPEQCEVIYKCLNCNHSYTEKKKVLDPNKMNLKVHHCPNCKKYGQSMLSTTFDNIPFQKKMIEEDGITLEIFIDSNLKQTTNPFGKKISNQEKLKLEKYLKNKSVV